MFLKTVFIGLLLLVLGAVGWSQRNAPWLQALVGSGDPPSASIRFDNGSVRDLAAASAPASNPSEKPLTMPGVRKCARGNTVVYTDKTCPPGSMEFAIGGTVNVVDGQARRPAPLPGHKPQDKAAAGVGESSLRDKYMEAVINR